MIVTDIKQPKSGFLSVQKDLEKVTNLVLSNKRLQKLLYYPTPDALNRPDLTDEEKYGLFGSHIKIVPKINVDNEVFCYVIISFDNFEPNLNNPEYRNNTISFDIICHYNQWSLGNFKLRPYLIAGEIDAMVNDQRFSGIGELQFMGAKQLVLNDEFMGLSVMYYAVHGNDDKTNHMDVIEGDDIIKNFNDMFNQ